MVTSARPKLGRLLVKMADDIGLRYGATYNDPRIDPTPILEAPPPLRIVGPSHVTTSIPSIVPSPFFVGADTGCATAAFGVTGHGMVTGNFGVGMCPSAVGTGHLQVLTDIVVGTDPGGTDRLRVGGNVTVVGAGTLSGGTWNWAQGNAIRFGHANQTNSDDGSIGAGLFESGLNIVGVQTVGGQGRMVRLFGGVIVRDSNLYFEGLAAANFRLRSSTGSPSALEVIAGDASAYMNFRALNLYATNKVFTSNNGIASVWARNGANSADIALIGLDSGDNLNIGRDDAIGATQFFGTQLWFDDNASPAQIMSLDTAGTLIAAGDVTGSRFFSNHATVPQYEFKAGSTRWGGFNMVAADVIRLYDSGGSVKLQFGLAGTTGKIIPPSTSISLRNNADSSDNVLIADSGATTIRGGLTLLATPLNFTAGAAFVLGTTDNNEVVVKTNTNSVWHFQTNGNLVANTTNGGSVAYRPGTAATTVKAEGVVFHDGVGASTTSTTDVTLSTFSLKANTLSASGHILRFKARTQFGGGGATWTVTFKIGGATVSTWSGTGTDRFVAETILKRGTTATNGTYAEINFLNTTVGGQSEGTMASDLTTDLTVSILGRVSSGATPIVLNWWTVEHLVS